MKNDTLIKFNEVTLVHYEKNKEKISKIKEEFEYTLQYCIPYRILIEDKINNFITKLDEIGNTIEGMETSVDYIDVVLKRIESKLEELEKIKP